MQRRDFFKVAAILPASAGFSAAAALQKRVKITGLETGLLRRPVRHSSEGATGDESQHRSKDSSLDESH